ncbi:putative histone acetyltransferase [Fusarium flagelliforme]|uniref:putative histone acetyltransferase n=1 Tax=Fusarium flagelliforme TaxID=2675880 RepID=UPI001E8CBBB5|nr:putative histone acetyltransferase [Fusarium flagelliforme]KAH7191844.1 putative histone acetyltransferase [Fusarium flagelliforme]
MDVISSTTWPEGLELHHVDTPEALKKWTPSLANLLHHCVNWDPPSSALGFHAPLPLVKSEEFWLSLSPKLSTTTNLFVLVRYSDRIVATVQLVTYEKVTFAHKVEIAKLLVREDERGLGLGRKLMEFAERYAKDVLGKSMVMLDTASDTPARGFYLKLGYTEWGVCPNYATSADGHIHDCSFFCKFLE